ncbi:putative Transglutaminase-like superfamily protein [Frankia canadensis]|uniref:Putative Transglutaminase-like superfamily protein n=1 Tax=Frankia canadensis TaxID=1836972 RepID=A0A2I2KP75_9ACTN|nr:transglutaminase domain-containing protein [Frankia canadensis]SNQ47471.1 putative Transglutaminase-like superfamily protein [Frankia canadensis]SOU54761.1 putative Transglutaminase-like superfamily protein [Frankia canadensis]
MTAASVGGGWRLARRLALVVAAVCAAGLVFQRAFPDEALVPAVAAGAVGGPAAALVATWLAQGGFRPRPTRWQARALLAVAGAIAAAAMWFVAGWLGVLHAQAPLWAPSTRRLLLTGPVEGPGRILESTLPVRPTALLVTVPYTITWLAGAFAMVRVRAPAASGRALAPAGLVAAAAVLLAVPGRAALAPATALLGVGALSAAGAPTDPMRLAAAPGSWGWRPPSHGVRGASRSRCTPRLRSAAGPLLATLLATIPVLLAAILAGTAARTVDHHPLDPRAAITPHTRQWTDISPLSKVSGWLREPRRSLFTVRSQRGPLPADPLRLAVLDRYDGHDWSTSAAPMPAGLGVPLPQDGLDAADRDRLGAPTRMHVTLGGLDGPLMPTMGRLVGLDGPDLSVDVASGLLLSRAGPRPGLSYQMTVRPVSAPKQSLVRDAVAPHPVSPAPVDASGPLAASLDALVVDVRRGAGSGYPAAVNLADTLRGRYAYDPMAGAGHSPADLAAFLDGARAGTPEQFAAVFALAADRLGMRTRLVVGFRVQGGPVLTVRGAQATVWPEVAFERFGWVAFDPTPRRAAATPMSSAAGAGGTGGRGAGSGGASGSAGAGTAGGGGGGATTTSQPPAPAPPPPGLRHRLLVIGGAASAGVLLCYLALVLLVPGMIRRGWRRHPDPRRRTGGAWLDLLAELDDGGTTLGPAAGRRDVEAAVRARIGVGAEPADGRALRRLSDQAGLALYARATPSMRAAGEAWADADRLRRSLRRTRPWHRRCADRLSPGRLRRPGPGGGCLGPAGHARALAAGRAPRRVRLPT